MRMFIRSYNCVIVQALIRTLPERMQENQSFAISIESDSDSLSYTHFRRLPANNAHQILISHASYSTKEHYLCWL